MGGNRTPTFQEEIRNLDKDSEDYKVIVRRHEAIQKAYYEKEAYRQRLVLRILELVSPLRGISRSKLGSLNNTQLTEVGMAAKSLNDAMKKAGIITHDQVSDKFDEF